MKQLKQSVYLDYFRGNKGGSFSSPLDHLRFTHLFKSRENAEMQKFAASSIYFQKSKKNSPNKTIIAFYFDSCCQKVLDSIYQEILFWYQILT